MEHSTILHSGTLLEVAPVMTLSYLIAYFVIDSISHDTPGGSKVMKYLTILVLGTQLSLLFVFAG